MSFSKSARRCLRVLSYSGLLCVLSLAGAELSHAQHGVEITEVARDPDGEVRLILHNGGSQAITAHHVTLLVLEPDGLSGRGVGQGSDLLLATESEWLRPGESQELVFALHPAVSMDPLTALVPEIDYVILEDGTVLGDLAAAYPDLASRRSLLREAESFENFLSDVRDLTPEQKRERLEDRALAGRAAMERADAADEAQRLRLRGQSSEPETPIDEQESQRAVASFGSYAEQLLRHLDRSAGHVSEAAFVELQQAVQQEVALLRSGLNLAELDRARHAYRLRSLQR